LPSDAVRQASIYVSSLHVCYFLSLFH
jgi:hypothetical protein